MYYGFKGFRTYVFAGRDKMSGYDYEKIVYQMLKKIRNPEHWKRIYTYIKVLVEKQGD